jgi:hypothetical protein
MRYIRDTYPEMWRVVAARMLRVQTVLDREMARIRPAIDEVSHAGR